MKVDINKVLQAIANGKEIEIKEQSGSLKSEKYINPTAATLMLMAKADEMTEYGVPVSKAVSDYTGSDEYLQDVLNYNRNELVTGAKARETLSLIFDESQFLNTVSSKTGKQLTYPVDIDVVKQENLISTLRAGTQPDNVTKKINRLGKECFALHAEFQIDVKMIEIRNNLYNPNFTQNLIDKVKVEVSNDMLRLATNGVEDNYASVSSSEMGAVGSHMYSLGIGWIKLLQDLNGTWTNSNKMEIVSGRDGNRITPNKVNIESTGSTSEWSTGFTSTLASFVDGGLDETITNDGSTVLKVAIGNAGTGGFAEHPGIEVTPNTTATLTYSIDVEGATVSAYIQVLDQANNVIAETPHTAADVTDSVLQFNTGNHKWLKLRLWQDTDSKYASFDDLDITVDKEKHDGNDIIDVMDKLVDSMPNQYLGRPGNEFIMSPEDAVAYSRAKGSPIQIVEGTAVGVNTEAREAWRVKGTVPAHEGYPVGINRMMYGINKSRVLGYNEITLNGSIIFGNRKELWFYAQEEVEKYRDYVGRLDTGGSGFEFGQHYMIDMQVGNCEAMCIAFKGAQVETPVIMKTNDPKSTACSDAEAFTVADAQDVYPYCDTKDVEIYVAASKSDLATAQALLADIETAKANGVALSSLADGTTALVNPGDPVSVDEFAATKTYYAFRAFRDGYQTKSDMISVNVD